MHLSHSPVAGPFRGSTLRWRLFLVAHPELFHDEPPTRRPYGRLFLGGALVGVALAGVEPAVGFPVAIASSAGLGATLRLDRGYCRRWLP